MTKEIAWDYILGRRQFFGKVWPYTKEEYNAHITECWKVVEEKVA